MGPRLGGALGLCATTIALWPVAPALAISDDTGDPPACRPASYAFRLSVAPRAVGLPLTGSTVEINAENAKLVATSARCVTYVRIPAFSWSVRAPAGGSAQLTDTSTLTPGLTLNAAGPHVVRLTACPAGCEVTLEDGTKRRVGASSADVTVTALASTVLPPETEPHLPDLGDPPPPADFSARYRYDSCQNGGEFIDPQWVTTSKFEGPSNYKLLEGKVESSKPSRVDQALNHDAHDHLLAVEPDPPYAGLVARESEFEDKSLMGVEWEEGPWARIFRPTPGDRTSIFGYWIFDCGHEPFYTEIHPPVGVAAHRSRAVTIPTSFRPPGFPDGLGSNVRVPGIVTHLWFNRKAGKITRGCRANGLAQPAKRSGNVFRDGDCIEEPSSLNRVFTFNVFLPRSPKARARIGPPPSPGGILCGPLLAESRAVGDDRPDIPLYLDTTRPSSGGGGPDPVIRTCSQGDATWLSVSVDLRGFTGNTYGRRITAAWAFPSPDNWDARRWRVRLDRLEIFDDSDPFGAGDGDWTLYFNTNNAHKEWARLIDCGGCVETGNHSLNLETGGSDLGPDPVLFPEQGILIHTAGYEDDGLFSDDDTGKVIDLISQEGAAARCQSASKRCRYRSRSFGDDGVYALNYEIRPGPTLGSAALTRAGRDLYDAYAIDGTPSGCTEIRPTRCVAFPANSPIAQDWHPRNLVLTRDSLRGARVPVLKPQEREEFTIDWATNSELKRVFTRVRKRQPRRLRRVLVELRQMLGRVSVKQRGDLYPIVFALQTALPGGLFREVLPSKLDPRRLSRLPLSSPPRD